MRILTMVTMLALLAGGAVSAAEPAAPEPGADGEALRARIEALQAEIADLQTQAEQAEVMADRRAEFRNIQAESREALKALTEHLKEIRNEEHPETGAGNRFINAALSHLNACRSLHEQILALKDVRDLDEARKLLGELGRY